MVKEGLLRILLCAFLCAGSTALCVAQVDGTLNNPILAGDHPDPTIIRVGKTYWTASTAGNWAPLFSLFRSTDLHHWTAAGAIFPHTPEWADRDFWAPELVSDRGRILVYYVARKRGGTLCVGVATAPNPLGPYVDHGPMECQEDGSIDPAFMRDEHDRPYLIWKEDGNSRNQPTRIWAQPLTDDLLHLIGDKTELLVNEPGSWEGGVVEAPYLMRHGGHFYLFYAGNACCGVECKYAEGVARADHLLGPWVKDPDNPIIRPNGNWRCPGHGTAVQTSAGKDLFLYHAYPASGFAYLGRESVIDTISWNAGGWPVVNQARGPGTSVGHIQSPTVADEFTSGALDAYWKWPVGHESRMRVADGNLTLTVPEDGHQSFVARGLLTPQYAATVDVAAGFDAAAGLGLIGDAQDDVVLSRHGATLELWQADHGVRTAVWTGEVESANSVTLRVSSTALGEAKFSYRVSSGPWSPAGDTMALKKLLPWDSGLRVGLVVDGSAGSAGSFRHFRLTGGGPAKPRSSD